MSHQASVYEKIVSDVLAGRAPVYKDYAAEWRRRGHHREEFAVFAEYVGYAAKAGSVRLILKSERRFGLPARRRYPGT